MPLDLNKRAMILCSIAVLLVILSIIALFMLKSPEAIAREVRFLPADMRLPEIGEDAAVVEARSMILELPVEIIKGDVGEISLSFAPESSDMMNGDFQDVYDTHRIFIEAHLEMPGAAYSPSGEVSQALLPNQPLMFLWTIRLDEGGEYRGTIWLHLRAIPKVGGAEGRIVLTAQVIQMYARTILGLGGAATRALCVVGLLVGVVMLVLVIFQSGKMGSL